ncbi:FCD domain-containing protein [Agrobacterium tumefaciens]|uniref:FCD domain-containing protein n=1 Tax=Agrobacterium tumefaciens TaxID=358 RepID=UPI00165ED858|nr:FCD domain-containing protein [Agrobacterium tumefaciens]
MALFTRSAPTRPSPMLKTAPRYCRAAEKAVNRRTGPARAAGGLGHARRFIDASAIRSSRMRTASIRSRCASSIRSASHRGHVKSVMKEHLAILEAIEKRSVEDAVERLTAHIRNARDRALAV